MTQLQRTLKELTANVAERLDSLDQTTRETAAVINDHSMRRKKRSQSFKEPAPRDGPAEDLYKQKPRRSPTSMVPASQDALRTASLAGDRVGARAAPAVTFIEAVAAHEQQTSTSPDPEAVAAVVKAQGEDLSC